MANFQFKLSVAVIHETIKIDITKIMQCPNYKLCSI